MKQEKAKQAGSSKETEKTKLPGNKSKGSNADSTMATQRTRAKNRHGHGLTNEGTNVSYEEER
ncbi:MAG: hypothetical protein ABJA78_02075 [Ferruginibacter sp.]